MATTFSGSRSMIFWYNSIDCSQFKGCHILKLNHLKHALASDDHSFGQRDQKKNGYTITNKNEALHPRVTNVPYILGIMQKTREGVAHYEYSCR